jgi:lysophospholipase L1-like esterase
MASSRSVPVNFMVVTGMALLLAACGGGGGGSASGGGNAPPTNTSGPTASPSVITEHQTAQLSVTASDPDGDTLNYTWQPASGTITGSGSTVTFNPPAVSADTVVRINVTVSDLNGLTATGYVDVTVQNVATNSPPSISAGPTATPADIYQDQTAQLSVTASDPDGDTLTYSWQAASGTITGSGSMVTFHPPAVSADTVVRIDLTVSDPGGLTASGSVDVTVRNVTGGTPVNVAGSSTVTASSQNTTTDQLATKAVDGVVDSYPGDSTREWATVAGQAGSWIRLDWASAYTVDHVTLYDRPNLNDQVLSGTLLFSDGTSMPVGALPNNGAALTVSFVPRTVTWVKFTINTVSSTTQNIGLAEIQIFATPSDQTVLYQENFNSGSAAGWAVVDDPTATHVPSIWGVVNGQYQESSDTRYSDDVGVFGQTADGYELTATYSRYDGGSFGPMDLRLQVRSTDIGVVGVLFGYQDNNNYYRLALSKREGYRRLEKKVNGLFTPLAQNTQSFTVGQSTGLRIVMENGAIIVFMDGEQVLAAVDPSFSMGKIALWDSRNGPCQFDDITVLTVPTQPVIGLTAPADYAVSGGGTLNAAAELTNTTNVGGVQFVLDEGTGGAQTQTDLGYPYTAQFNFANAGTHEVRAYVLDGSSQRMSGIGAVDIMPGIGVNGYYLVGFGDSITDGVFDDLATDDISLDGRDTSGGYEPVLNNLLTAYYNKPVTVVDEGHPGDTAPQGWAKIATSLNRTQGSQTYLVMFGTNDSNQSLPEPPGLNCYPGLSCYTGSYKEAMQGIIDAIIGTGQKVYLAKAPPIIGNATLNTVIEQFNLVIDQLVTDNAGTGLVYAGPDFYTYFTNSPGQIGPDDVHPNGAGYAAMGQLWRNSLAGKL